MVGCVTTLGVGYITSLFDRPPDAKQLAGLTWSERPKEPDVR
jgi:hypothetical protein